MFNRTKQNPNSNPDKHCQIINSRGTPQPLGFPGYMQKDRNTQVSTEVHITSVPFASHPPLSVSIHSYIPGYLYGRIPYTLLLSTVVPQTGANRRDPIRGLGTLHSLELWLLPRPGGQQDQMRFMGLTRLYESKLGKSHQGRLNLLKCSLLWGPRW